MQRPVEAPNMPECCVYDPNMQELAHSRALANDLQKAQEEQLAEIARISKELESFEPVGIPLVMVHRGASLASLVRACKNSPFFCELPLRLMHLSPDRTNSQRLTGCFFLLCDADVSCRFCRSATNAAKRLPECVWKKNKR